MRHLTAPESCEYVALPDLQLLYDVHTTKATPSQLSKAVKLDNRKSSDPSYGSGIQDSELCSVWCQ